MAVFSLSPRALLLALLVTTGVIGNPIDLNPGDTITPCATVKCSIGTTCEVIDGKAHCVPVGGTKCGNAVCEKGTSCCNSSCSLCVKPGMACTQHICPPVLVQPPAEGQCGPTVCKRGLECCNPSCGICVEPGHGCTKQFCAPKNEQCGKTLCAPGLVCCNSSCGICAPPDGACTQQYCLDSN